LYTRCPNCLTVFIVGAEQLRAAHGNVRCGTCLESFDAIPHLSDGPPQPAATTQSEQHGAVEELGNAKSAAERLTSTLDAVRAAAGLEDRVAADAIEADSGREELVSRSMHSDEAAAYEHAQDSNDGDTAETMSGLDVQAEAVDESLPDVLREDVAERAARADARRRNIGYGTAALALLVLLAVQYFFFMPEDAVRRYPQFRGAIELLCERFGCVLPEHRDPSRIRVISRDVRVHPRYEGVLQIKATLANAANFRQPYPRVRFTLFNVNGQTIATRVFQPAEYLGRPVAASARLRPQTPFQVELDVLAPEEAAVSFEFQFL
jgi:predicted Zn finger-like uncharacterized protein